MTSVDRRPLRGFHPSPSGGQYQQRFPAGIVGDSAPDFCGGIDGLRCTCRQRARATFCPPTIGTNFWTTWKRGQRRWPRHGETCLKGTGLTEMQRIAVGSVGTVIRARSAGNVYEAPLSVTPSDLDDSSDDDKLILWGAAREAFLPMVALFDGNTGRDGVGERYGVYHRRSQRQDLGRLAVDIHCRWEITNLPWPRRSG